MPEPTWDGERWSDDDPKTDDEKHAFCKFRTGYCATFVPCSLYEQAQRSGVIDMRWFVPVRPMPKLPGRRSHR